jgi:EPS-associated MarR family transcriptional regulator
MTSQRAQLHEDIRFRVMRRLQETPDISQRELARELGISLGSVNFCLQALMEKGWVKIQNFSNSKHKLGYVYLLTPTGISGKAALTARFLKRKMDEYDALLEEIEALRQEVAQQDASKCRRDPA